MRLLKLFRSKPKNKPAYYFTTDVPFFKPVVKKVGFEDAREFVKAIRGFRLQSFYKVSIVEKGFVLRGETLEYKQEIETIFNI